MSLWPSIEAFYNVRKYCGKLPEVLGENKVVEYKPKIKLHGTNLAIEVFENEIIPNSRSKRISISSDNAGSAKFSLQREQIFLSARKNFGKDFIVFGEFAGKRIQSGVACSQVDPFFAIFAVRCGKEYIVEPSLIEDLFSGSDLNSERIYILPWFKDSIFLNPISLDEELQAKIDLVNEDIIAIEKEDPWIKHTFGVSGVGEGLVFYPISHMSLTSDLMWKAKGEKHRVKESSVAVEISAEIISKANDFAKVFCTEARLKQGALECGGFEQKNIGKFIGWVSKDIEKESKDEFLESGLEWKQINKFISDISRKWFLSKL